MGLSTCDQCGGHIPLGPYASNRCESCGLHIFEPIDKSYSGAKLHPADQEIVRLKQALLKIIEDTGPFATDESPEGWHWIGVIKTAKEALGLPIR